MGVIETIVGPMFSGKTTELLRRIEREKLAKKKIIMFKPEIDNRYGVYEIRDRNRRFIVKAEILPITADKNYIENLIEKTKNFDVIGIDEIQFFDKWIIDFVKIMRKNNKKIIVSGLDMDFRGETFGIIGNVMAISNKVDKLSAVCTICGQDAIFTQKLYNNNPYKIKNTDENIIEIGDNIKNEDKIHYEARCEKCYVDPY